ncbi:hypothetical protein GJ496_004091 [Pomphorhynchus laevis]|nr:hypothetical protein GJ496_004091 [Pomphorhynchus laevis]
MSTTIIAQNNDTKSNKLMAFLRIRPLSEDELRNQPFAKDLTYSISDNTTLTVKVPETSAYFRRDGCNDEVFEFSHVFSEYDDQEDIFVKMVVPCIEQIMNSRSVLVFAYGITNSGKSYTMRGNDSNPGIIPHFASSLFNIIRKCRVMYPNTVPITINYPMEINFEKILSYRKPLSTKATRKSLKCINTFLQDPEQFRDGIFYEQFEDSDIHSNVQFYEVTEICFTDEIEACGIWCSYVEVYNNLVFDLLSPRRRAVVVGEDTKGYPFVKDLTRIPVFTSSELIYLFDMGRMKLQMAHTLLNTNSSRSHSIFSIAFITESKHQNKIAIRNIEFCDLAGSERCKSSGATGSNLTETCKINSSLSALHRCIDCLRPKSKNRASIKPSYRESKLTRLFQPYFVGFGLIRMIANISQNYDSFDQNLNALRFTAMAQQVRTTQRDIVYYKNPNTMISHNYIESIGQSLASEIQDNNVEDIDDQYGFKLWSKKALIEELILEKKSNLDLQNHNNRILNDWSTQLEETEREHEEEIKALEKAWENSLNNRVLQVEEELRAMYRSKILKLKSKIVALELNRNTLIPADITESICPTNTTTSK